MGRFGLERGSKIERFYRAARPMRIYHRLDEAAEHVVGSPAYLETSWPPSLAGLDAERVRSMIQRHGADRVIFGTDWPMTDPAAELAAVRALGLTAAEEQAILGGNLAALLGLDASRAAGPA
jgi:uncharacterized protein